MFNNVMITAHSGVNGTEPNSYAYLEYAMKLDVDAIEIDIRKNDSKRLYLSHDKIKDGQFIYLEEAFEILKKSSQKINFDLKEYGLEDEIFQLAKKFKIDEERIIFTGSVTDCMNISSKIKEHTYINIEEIVHNFYLEYEKKKNQSEFLDNAVSKCFDAGYKVINVDYRIGWDRIINICKKNSVKASIWTLNNKQELEEMKLDDIENITIKEWGAKNAF